MRIVFAGTPDFAAAVLRALAEAGHDIALVLTQPDRPAGRGLQAVSSPVKRLAQSLALSVFQPASLRTPDVCGALAAIEPDAMVVAAYGLIVPPDVLAVPRLGCINIHASLLPRWRGAAPIQRALLAGDVETGISIMQMDEGLDTGPVLLQHVVAIAGDDTAQSLHDRLAAVGARLVLRALESPPRPQPQDNVLATYAAKIDKREASIDWTERADAIERKIRAFNPAPGAATSYRETRLKIWRADVAPAERAIPGEIFRIDGNGLTVACGCDTALTILELQRAGGKRLPAAAFLSGNSIKTGDALGRA